MPLRVTSNYTVGHTTKVEIPDFSNLTVGLDMFENESLKDKPESTSTLFN